MADAIAAEPVSSAASFAAFEEEAIEAIARKAMDRKTGARGLKHIMESVMVDIMYEVPSLEGNKEVVITKEVIEKTAKAKALLVKDKKTA